MNDVLSSGCGFITSNVVDDFNREILTEIDLNPPSQRIFRVLVRVEISRGYPAMTLPDNGTELTSLTLSEWA